MLDEWRIEPGKTSRSLCPVETVHAHFAALLLEETFEQELLALGIGKLRFRHRKEVVASLRALHVALWRLALIRSFPNEYETIFSLFLESLRERSGASRILPEIPEQEIRDHVERLQCHGANDFTDVAAYLVSRFKLGKPDDAAARLRLILLIRRAYTTIFDHLI